MIQQLEQPFTDEQSLAELNPYVRKWFLDNFKELTPPQKYSFKLISEKKNLLIAAPTGSGKTMSAFLSIISRLFDLSLKGELEDRVYCIYISPLKALNNDIYKNLTTPLEEIYQTIVKEKGVDIIKSNIKKVSIAVRTGDTPQSERRKQLIHPPNIFVTTPESLAIILNSEKFLKNLEGLEYVIIDELHELANNKRGVHLSLSAERLLHFCGKEFVRIGLGATLHPIEEAARFLVGYNGDKERDCIVVDASWSKEIDVTVMSPVKDLIYTSGEEIENSMYLEIDRIIKKSKTALIFTNTRSGTERVVFNLKKRFAYGEGIAAHHGSLSKDSRLEVEELLKKGSLKCAVSSTSLELGIDIGSIDNVIQLGSAKSVTRAVQRFGRAGHSFKEVARGEDIVLTRDDLVECTVMMHSAKNKQLDSFTIPKNALDVLAQHIVGMSLADKWDVDDAFALVRNAYPYRSLEKRDFMKLLDYLAGNYVGLESRRVYAKIWYDEKEKTFGKRGRFTKVIYMLNLGTIPDEVAVNVFSTSKKWIGNIEEEFLSRLKQGDIFTLGGRLYKFEYARGTKCYVSEARATAPTIPPWFSEQLPLSYELALEIGRFREKFGNEVKRSIGRFVKGKALQQGVPEKVNAFLGNFPIDENAKDALFGYFAEQLLFAKCMPNDHLIVVESTAEEDSDSRHLIFHSLFGRRVNDALSRIFAMLLGEMLDIDVAILVNDNGFVLSTEENVELNKGVVDDMMSDIITANIVNMLKRNIKKTELMRRRFRHVAARSFMILRNYKGYKITVGRQQVNSQLVMKAAEEIDPDFPIIKEAYREIFEDVMDLERTKEIIANMAKGRVKYKFIKTPSPSPFSHSMITFGHADVVLMKERQEYLKTLHNLVMEKIGARK
ncbi:MAG: ATP-dependent helicase [Candidatus Marsarchaeota archaeon]|nr:ATP-dependent helicase [Candidatus Marsarchaeota archaeon]MCL5115042.1 ATP-dependent helicase [Candidatus Marsarchaeota archaeon]